jgi:hypothetical protein
MNALIITNIILLAAFLPLNAVLVIREIKNYRARRLFSKLFWETYQIGQDDE